MVKKTIDVIKKQSEVNMVDLALAMQAEGCTSYSVNLEDTAPVKQTVSFGDFILDMITGGGCPVGKQIEIIGFESSGKTTLAQTLANNVVNKHNGYVDIIDNEDLAWDFPYRNIQ
jgi:RecA/RadA recombinase